MLDQDHKNPWLKHNKQQMRRRVIDLTEEEETKC